MLSVTFSYDKTGNLTGYDDGLTSGSYSDNALNQTLSETVTSPNFSKFFSYDYTANGLKKSFTMPDGTTYEYTYGDNNELREIRLPGTGAISYPSYTWTRPDAVLYPGGGRREYDYDPLMRITRILAKDPGKNIVLDYSYSYDSMDNILSKQTERGTYNYTYDALYRLTDVQVDIPGQEHEGFSYDAVGNRLSEQGVDGEWTYNPNNELLTFATTEYTYDANGNAIQLLLDGTVMFTYHYNAQDRLVQVDDVNSNTVAEYSYDPFGRRLWKEVNGTRTYFFYADAGLVAEYDTSGTEIRAYGYRPDSTWTTDPLWLKQGGEYYFYQNDHLGTPQKLVKQNGAIAWSANYTAFGKATIEVETGTNNLRFPGQYFDAETGLHYNYFRYYAPSIRRYLRKDPISFLGGENLFIYGRNNALSYADMFGLNAVCFVGLGAMGGTGPVWLSISLWAVQELETGKGWQHAAKNSGILVCTGGTVSAGENTIELLLTILDKGIPTWPTIKATSGGVAGFQGGCLTDTTLCGLAQSGLSGSIAVGGGDGPGFVVEVNTIGVIVTGGVGFGGYAALINGVLGSCYLILSEKRCGDEPLCLQDLPIRPGSEKPPSWFSQFPWDPEIFFRKSGMGR